MKGRINIVCLTIDENKQQTIKEYIEKGENIIDCTDIEVSLTPYYFRELVKIEKINYIVNNIYCIKSLLIDLKNNKKPYQFIFKGKKYRDFLGKIFEYYSKPMRFLMNGKEKL